MNFEISIDSTGRGAMTWDKPSDISTNIWWALNTNTGSLINNPGFGLQIDDIKKVTTNNINLMKQRIESSLQHLLDIGKADAINVIVERDTLDRNRINYKVTAFQADGIPIVVDGFKTIGGPSSSFSV